MGKRPHSRIRASVKGGMSALPSTAIAVALTRPESALVLAGYTAVALVVGSVLLYRRDTD